jgi:hypothetical protein
MQHCPPCVVKIDSHHVRIETVEEATEPLVAGRTADGSSPPSITQLYARMG